MWLEGLRHGLEVNRLTDCMQEGGTVPPGEGRAIDTHTRQPTWGGQIPITCGFEN